MPQHASTMSVRYAVLEALLKAGADPGHKAIGLLGTPLDAASGMHRQRSYRFAWTEAVALLEEASVRAK